MRQTLFGEDLIDRVTRIRRTLRCARGSLSILRCCSFRVAHTAGRLSGVRGAALFPIALIVTLAAFYIVRVVASNPGFVLLVGAAIF